MINIIIGGDIVPVGRSEKYFKDGDAKGIFNELLFEFEKAHMTIANLECPLINKDTPIVKCGPVLGVENACIHGIKQAHIAQAVTKNIKTAILSRDRTI